MASLTAGGTEVQKLATGDFIYQVKWTSKRIQDPVAWLAAAIRREHDNITRLVEKGAAHYYLLTSVAGTSATEHGSMDRLDEALLEHSKVYGIPMTCWWQADLHARVDGAPSELKWAYPDMLAGTDAIQYLIDADVLAAHDRDLKALLRKVIATQWHEGARVKFKQVELPAPSPPCSPSATRSSHQSWPGSADQDQDGHRRHAPASTATTKTSAPPCAPCSTTSQSAQPHRQQIVDQRRKLLGPRVGDR